MDDTNTQQESDLTAVAAAPDAGIAMPEAPVPGGAAGGRKAVETDPLVWVPEHGKSRMRTGRVTSNKMEKTVVVSVDRLVRHRLYKKIIRRTSTFVAHDELKCNNGDIVRIIETRPISKTKRWRVVDILTRAPQI
jgi:small subunit ribosomal protein S17